MKLERSQVRLLIEAPKGMQVFRQELLEANE